MKKSKGILPDGKKIKELRKQAGKTQKGLIQGSPIELRTYQRAEQGLPILPELLQRIGVLFGKDASELTLHKQPPKQSEHSFRLYCASHQGANKLVSDLQSWTTDVEFAFHISPGGEVAERVASVVEYCQRLEVNDDSRALLTPAESIRAVGYLNDQLGLLTLDDVHTYAGQYYTYNNEVIKRDVDGQAVGITLPMVKSHLRIIFYHERHDFISDTYPSYRSWEAAAERATRWNLKQGVDPKLIEEADPFDDSYPNHYSKAHAQLEAEKPVLLLAANGRAE